MSGLFVPPRDASALAEPIVRLLKDPALAARIDAAGRPHVLTTHGADRMVEDFVRLWRSLGAGDRP